MKIREKRLAIYLLALMALTLSAAVLRTLAVLRDFNRSSGFFDKKGLINAASVALALAFVLIIAYIIFGKQRSSLVANSHNPLTYIPSGFVALSFIFVAREVLSGGEIFDSQSTVGHRLIVIFIAVFAMLSVAYFFLNSYLGSRYSRKRSMFALAPIICLLLYAIYLYTDTTLPMNSPNKIVDEFAYAAAALFFCAEARISLGREKWRVYVPLGMVSMLLTAYSSLPATVVYFLTLIRSGEATLISRGIGEIALTLALFIYVTARVSLVVFLKEDKQGVIAVIVAERNNKTEQATELPDGTEDENQISFDDIIEEVPQENTESEICDAENTGN